MALSLVLLAASLATPANAVRPALATNGSVEKARPLFARAFSSDPRWRELVKRLPKVGQVPDAPKLIDAILAIK